MSSLYVFYPETGKVVFSVRADDLPCVPVYITGTFTLWERRALPEWQLSRQAADDCYVLEKSYTEVAVPGNCGYPEYTFFTVDASGQAQPLSLRNDDDERNIFLGNYVLLFPGDDRNQFLRDAARAACIRTKNDFMPLDGSNTAAIANFRKVPGTSCVYRSYHPYKKSFPQYDTEDIRSACVKRLLEEKNIASIICLCGNEPADHENGEYISAYQQKIIDSGNEYFTDTDYSIVYYCPDKPVFAELFSGIISFIASHQGPYLVHCRLGSDRTGTVCALLAALCGAEWNAIAQDYEKTSNLGICQYRNRRLIRYFFNRFLGVDVPETGDFADSAARRCIATGVMSGSILEKAISNMKK